MRGHRYPERMHFSFSTLSMSDLQVLCRTEATARLSVIFKCKRFGEPVTRSISDTLMIDYDRGPALLDK
jgi:hypothetical protein